MCRGEEDQSLSPRPLSSFKSSGRRGGTTRRETGKEGSVKKKTRRESLPFEWKGMVSCVELIDWSAV